MSDVLTAEEREVVDELREMSTKGFYSVACDFDAKCVAIIDRLVREVETLRAEAADWRKGHDRHAADVSRLSGIIDKLTEACKSSGNDVSRLTRERDEARAALENMCQPWKPEPVVSTPYVGGKTSESYLVATDSVPDVVGKKQWSPRPAAKEE